MKKIKVITALVLAVSMLCPFAVFGSAYQEAYNNDLSGLEFVSPFIKDQGKTGLCLYNAVASCAENFVLKYWKTEKEFDAAALAEKCKNGDGYVTEWEQALGIINGKNLTGTENEYRVNLAELPVETEDNIKEIKKAVKEYGSVVICFDLPGITLSNGYYFNELTSAFYCDEPDPANAKQHAVCVVGWDDNYSGENFETDPGENGAWICKNSYGDKYGEGGYFRLSYKQSLIGAATVSVLRGNESNAGIDTIENWDDTYLKTVFVAVDGNEKHAYAVDENGNTYKCEIFKDYTTGCYAVYPPEKTYFGSKTACYFNGDTMPLLYVDKDDDIPDDNHPFYKIDDKTSVLLVCTKEKVGFGITKIETAKYNLGYIKLTYDDGSVRRILKGDFEKNKITLTEFKDNEQFNNGNYSKLPGKTPEGKQYYAVIEFDDETYAFANGVEYNSETTGLDTGSRTMVVIVTPAEPMDDLVEILVGLVKLMFVPIHLLFNILPILGN